MECKDAAYCYVCSTGLCVCVFLCVVYFGELKEPCDRRVKFPSMGRCWCGYLCEARCTLFAYGPADANASEIPTVSCLI